MRPRLGGCDLVESTGLKQRLFNKQAISRRYSVATALDGLRRNKRMSRPARASQACVMSEVWDFVDLQLELLCAISVLARAWDKSVG